MIYDEMNSPEYPWYKEVNGEPVILQGDILFNFPVLIPAPELFLQNDNSENSPIEFGNIDAIVITQSCNLIRSQPEDTIVLCPLYDFDKTEFNSKDKWNTIRKGMSIGKSLLNRYKSEDFSLEFKLVDLQNVYTTNFKVILDFIQKFPKRLRLLPPYREHLSFQFSYQFMRIGLPDDIQTEYPF